MSIALPSPAGVHGGGDDATPAGCERRCDQKPLSEGQEEEGTVAGLSSPRSPGERDTCPLLLHCTSSFHNPLLPFRQVNLNELSKKLGLSSGNLRFADEAIMLEKLKVRTCHLPPMCVASSLWGAVHDHLWQPNSCTSSSRPGGPGLCHSALSALRQGPECEVGPGPGLAERGP